MFYVTKMANFPEAKELYSGLYESCAHEAAQDSGFECRVEEFKTEHAFYPCGLIAVNCNGKMKRIA